MSTEEILQGFGSIQFLAGPLKDQVFPLDKEVVTIGSDASNDVVIKDDAGVSRFHAWLMWSERGWSIQRHAQAGVVTVNALAVEQAMIGEQATVRLGKNTSFRVVASTAPIRLDPTPTQAGDTGAINRAPTVEHMEDEGAINRAPTAGWEELESTLIAHVDDQTLPLKQSLPPSLAHLAGLSAHPEATQITPLATLGIPSLEIRSNASGEKSMHTLDKPVIDIGRSSTNDIVVRSQNVSGQHLQIIRQGNSFVLVHPHPERKQTLNGLLYQGRKIRGDEHFRKVLAQGDVFRIGNENGTFVTLTYDDGSGVHKDALPPMRPIRLQDAEVTIGRLPDNTVELNHPQVSAHHARLVREGGTYRILDLHSTNHVYVNAQIVTNALLKMGDEIRIGPYRLVFEGTRLAEYDESSYIRIDALNLKKYGNNHVTLLNNISLTIAPRKFVAIVGGSGAGKSMLIDALSGLRPAHEGKVLYNGQDYYRNIAAFNTQLGYVPQDDIVHRDLTVERALYYAARMRLPGDFTKEQIWQRIAEVLEDVEMTGKQKLLIRKLSGGQRKRVSMALELLANPSLFFLDEPTSGLDPGLDRKMMFLLRKLADKGHTIILVTHATNNISTCDYVCFLAQGGRLAYFGPPEEARVYFGKDDFAEIYSSLEGRDESGPYEDSAVPEEAEVRFRNSQDYQTYVAQPLKEAQGNLGGRDKSRPYEGKDGGAQSIAPAERKDGGAKFIAPDMKHLKRSNPWKQFLLLTMRQLELLKNNVSNASILLLQAPLVAFLLILLVRFEIGGGIFDANHLVQCRTQILTSSGPLALPGVSNIADLVDCQRVVNFLNTDPNGVQYAQSRGGTSQALQDFITPAQSGDAQRVIFLVAFFAAIFGIINGTREIVKEIGIYRRERAVALRILPYLFSKMMVLGVLALVQGASMLLIVHILEPFSQSVFLPVLLEMYITLALAGVAGVMMGLLISALAPNDDTANSLLPIIIIPQVIFAGSIIPLKDWFTQGVAALFPTRWALTAMGSSLGLHSDKIDGGKLFGNDPTYHGTLFSIYSQADATLRVVISWVALGITILVLTLIIGIFLKMKDNRNT